MANLPGNVQCLGAEFDKDRRYVNPQMIPIAGFLPNLEEFLPVRQPGCGQRVLAIPIGRKLSLNSLFPDETFENIFTSVVDLIRNRQCTCYTKCPDENLSMNCIPEDPHLDR
jgi:hypothetical protein